MGLRFRKRIAGGKLFRINLSTTGISLGIGPPGLNVNIGPRGIRRTVGLPGTGIHYQDSSQWPTSNSPPPAIGNGSTPPSHFPWVVMLVLVGIVLLVGRCVQQATESTPSANRSNASTSVPAAVAAPRPADLQTKGLLFPRPNFVCDRSSGTASATQQARVQHRNTRWSSWAAHACRHTGVHEDTRARPLGRSDLGGSRTGAERCTVSYAFHFHVADCVGLARSLVNQPPGGHSRRREHSR